MPDKKKTSDKQELPLDQVQDAVIVDAQTGDDTTSATGDSGAPERETAPEDAIATAEKPEDKPATASESDQDSAAAALAGDSTDAQTIAPEPAPEDAALASTPPMQDSAPNPAPQTVTVQKVGFLPMVLGGVVAAVIGFGIARSGVMDNIIPPRTDPTQETTQQALAGLNDQIAAQDSSLTDLSDRLAALENAPAAESVEMPDFAPQLDELSSRLGAIDERLAALEARPESTGAGPDAATSDGLAAARTELENLRQLIEAQQSDIASLRDEAAREEEAAQLTAERALQRAALARIQTALDSGTAYDAALTDLQETALEVPQPLAEQAETGVATLSALQASFPDLAREALRVARQGAGETGLTAFLQTQLGVRSLDAREGNDPDAVLSRAEAALQQANLPDALTELQALPEAAQAVLADWRAQAETRLAALAAAQDLSQSLNTN